MGTRKPKPPPDLAELLDSWDIVLQAEHKSPKTIRTYRDGVRGFLRWCDTNATDPVLTRAAVLAFTANLLANGAEPATARARQQALRRFSAWLAEEGELDTDPLLGMRPPRLDAKVVEPLDAGELKMLLKACAGTALRDRRDEAIIRLMAETGARAGEVTAMLIADVDLKRGGGAYALSRGVLHHATLAARLAGGGGGKTTAGSPQALVPRSSLIPSLSSPALLPRMLNNGMRTILLDEVHRTLNSDRPGIGDLVAIINTGHRVGATRPVNVQVKGGRWEVVDMPTFAPVAMAGNDPNLENDTRSRMIRVLLMPDLDGSAEDSDWEYLEDEAAALQEEIALSAASARETVKGCASTFPPDVSVGPRTSGVRSSGLRWPPVDVGRRSPTS